MTRVYKKIVSATDYPHQDGLFLQERSGMRQEQRPAGGALQARFSIDKLL